MMRTLLPASLLLLVPYTGHAQDTLPNLMADHAYFGPAQYANATDSADFSHFRNGLRTVQPTGTKDTTKLQYRMVWREDQHGGRWSVSRGDSSLWQAREYASLDPFMGGPFATADGRRGVLVVHERPCGYLSQCLVLRGGMSWAGDPCSTGSGCHSSARAFHECLLLRRAIVYRLPAITSTLA